MYSETIYSTQAKSNHDISISWSRDASLVALGEWEGGGGGGEIGPKYVVQY